MGLAYTSLSGKADYCTVASHPAENLCRECKLISAQVPRQLQTPTYSYDIMLLCQQEQGRSMTVADESIPSCG